jgi:putative membrane protein
MRIASRISAVAVATLLSVAPRLEAQSQAGKPAAKLDDPTIVAIFDAANTWDIETGSLAVKKGSTQDVRDFGKMLVNDHTNVRQQGRDLAKKLGVTPTPPKDFSMAADHKAAMKKLEGLSGPAFDKAFYTHEVAYHKAVLDAMTGTLLPALQNADVKKLVNTVAPAFNAHMMAAQNRLDKLAK